MSEGNESPTGENIIDRLDESIVQEGKVVLTDEVQSEIDRLASQTRPGLGLLTNERVVASGKLSKIVRKVASIMQYGSSNYGYKPTSLNEARDIAVHNSNVGSGLIKLFADQISDPDPVAANEAVYATEQCLSGFLGISGFKLEPDLANRISSDIRSGAEKGVFKLNSEADRIPVTVLAMVKQE